MSEQESPYLLPDHFGGFRAQHAAAAALMRLDFIEAGLEFPALIVSGGQFGSGGVLRVHDGGNQAEDLFFSLAVRHLVLDDPHRNSGRLVSNRRSAAALARAAGGDFRYPAREVIVLYRERWEIETCYFELKSTILGGRVLRARTPDGVEQEVWALLVTYQALRVAIADASAAFPGADPDRASFTIALNAARDQVVLAAGVTAGAAIDLAGTIGRTVLASLMLPRRLRTSPRVVKRAISKYNARGTIDRTTRKATIDIAILAAP